MSFWKQDPPKPTDALRNFGPMRESVPIACDTCRPRSRGGRLFPGKLLQRTASIALERLLSCLVKGMLVVFTALRSYCPIDAYSIQCFLANNCVSICPHLLKEWEIQTLRCWQACVRHPWQEGLGKRSTGRKGEDQGWDHEQSTDGQ